ncbi:MAG: hypothetical protein M0R80_24265 [Proteobacteria bacterium]|jgi:hypothetical protein|nr:hypothetical protein [Pseudomonadota bacterium]
MTHGTTILGKIAALGLAASIACGDPWDDGAAGCWGAFCYAPSNVDPDVLDGTLSDLIFEGSACASAARIDTDDCRVDCAAGARCEIDLLPDGGEVAVLAVARFAVLDDIDVEIVGARPLAVLAAGEVEIRGSISAIDPIFHFNGCGGGYGCGFTTEPVSGDGPGGGGASYGSGGAGGGGHCGAGGAGGNGTDGSLSPGEGGGTYGHASIVPLAGGSAGGKRSLGTGGAGGGAIQISSAVAISIAEGGSINMSGHGGKGNAGGGGGAGGAILLEAPQVLVAGALAANGGGGGSGGLFGDGMPGQDGAEPAAGGVSADGASGGDGAYGGAIAGAKGGAFAGGISGGGGGGGGGWIRINTADGNAQVQGVVSPSLASGCASVGEIAAP